MDVYECIQGYMPEERGFQVAIVGRQAMDCPFYERKKVVKAIWDNGEKENCTTCEHWDLWDSECGKEEELKEWGVNKA